MSVFTYLAFLVSFSPTAVASAAAIIVLTGSDFHMIGLDWQDPAQIGMPKPSS